jgi:hypothetical protein
MAAQPIRGRGADAGLRDLQAALSAFQPIISRRKP